MVHVLRVAVRFAVWMFDVNIVILGLQNNGIVCNPILTN